MVIIGAGVAGLAALRDLDRAGKSVLCLEARDRIGGRIYTVHDPLSAIPIELGAEFVHGKPQEIIEIVESAPLTLYKCMEHAVHVRNGKPVRDQEAWLHVDEVMDDLKHAVEAGREESFAEFLAKSNHGPEAKELALLYVEGFNAATRQWIGRTAQNKTLNFTDAGFAEPAPGRTLIGEYADVMVTRAGPNSLAGERISPHTAPVQ